MRTQALLAVVLMSLSSLAFAGQVNVNKADAKALAKELTGVGDVTATRIVEERKHGDYKDMTDLKVRVVGFGDKTATKNAENIRFKD